MSSQTEQPLTVSGQQYGQTEIHSSIGPLIAAVVVVTILGVIAGMIGRLCSGRTIFGYGNYDLENWVETKCANCVDGRVEPLSAPAQHVAVAVGGETEGSEEQSNTAASPH
ncbi:hypothetical protein QQ045_032483 [Rhodiola kirilowii]